MKGTDWPSLSWTSIYVRLIAWCGSFLWITGGSRRPNESSFFPNFASWNEIEHLKMYLWPSTGRVAPSDLDWYGSGGSIWKLEDNSAEPCPKEFKFLRILLWIDGYYRRWRWKKSKNIEFILLDSKLTRDRLEWYEEITESFEEKFNKSLVTPQLSHSRT